MCCPKVSFNKILNDINEEIRQEYINDLNKNVYDDMYIEYFPSDEREKQQTKSAYGISSVGIPFSKVLPFDFTLSIYLNLYNKVEVWLLSDFDLQTHVLQLKKDKKFRQFLKFLIHLETKIEPVTYILGSNVQ